MTKEYFVVQHAGDWHLRSWDINLGPYPSRGAALAAAVAQARKDHRNMVKAKVFLEESDAGGRMVVYDSGVDR